MVGGWREGRLSAVEDVPAEPPSQRSTRIV